MDRFREFLKFAGKRDGKVLAVFATSAASAAPAVRYLRRQVPGVPVYLFSTACPEAETAALCEHVTVEADSMALLVAAQKELWPYWVALSVATWTGDRLRWPVKAAPFLVPPFRALILNRHGDFVPGSAAHVALHWRRMVRDALHSGWNGACDLARGYRLWLFALLAQYFAPVSRRAFLRGHGSAALSVPFPPAEGTGVEEFRYAHRQWDHARLTHLLTHSPCRWMLFLESGAEAGDLVTAAAPLLDDQRTFAVARQVAYRAWRPCLFPIAPFRQLQPGEAAQTMGPLSNAILVDRAKLAALGLPRTVVPGSAWMLLCWQAAAAGWRSYSLGGAQPLDEFPDWPYEDAEFVTRVLGDPALRALGPREPSLARGAIAFHPLHSLPAPTLRRPCVLVVSPYLPWPLSHGGAVRIWNLCRALAPRVDFLLACFREEQDVTDYARLHEVFREVWVVDRDQRALPDAVLPAQAREHASAAMSALIDELCRTRPVDLLQMEFTHLAAFRDAAPRVPAILVEHDLTFTLYRQFAAQSADRAARQEYERWLAFERRWFAHYDGVWTMSEQDRAQAVEAGGYADRTFVVANGVDTARFRPTAPPPGGPPEVLYIGSFRHRPNLIGFERLAGEIMPAVWARCAAARLCVVAGPEPERHWRRPARLDPRIAVHAFVDDVRPLYARAAVVAVPLVVSAGTNIKVMEAMACGRPVVSTPVGCQGLGLEDGRDVVIRSTSAELAAAICELLDDPERAAALARHARATVEARFSWDAIAESAWSSYRALLDRPR